MSATDRLSALDGDSLLPDDANEYRNLIGGLKVAGGVGQPAMPLRSPAKKAVAMPLGRPCRF
jgi:hypothetical protein